MSTYRNLSGTDLWLGGLCYPPLASIPDAADPAQLAYFLATGRVERVDPDPQTVARDPDQDRAPVVEIDVSDRLGMISEERT